MAFPLILVFSVIDLVIFLSLASHILSHLGLSCQEEELGLPKGSVRALIASSLIVIFAIMTIYMQMQLSASPLKDADGNILRYDNGTVIFYEPSQDKKDFVLQTQTTISTLVVAVAGFYFGTRAVQVAQGSKTTAELFIEPSNAANVKNGESLTIVVKPTPTDVAVVASIENDTSNTLVQEDSFRWKYTPSINKGKTATITFKMPIYDDVSPKELKVTVE